MKILDCTIRDGGYINNWRFTDKFIDSYIDIINKLNIDYTEIGFINKETKYRGKIVGKYRALTKDTILMFKNRLKTKIVVMADYKKIDLELLNNKMDVDLVRIAFHKEDMTEALLLCKKIKSMGYKVSANAMAITNYKDCELNNLFKQIDEYSIDVLYIADSYGSLSQKVIKSLLKHFKSNVDCDLGIHLHNNMQNAFSNFECVLGEDIIVDSTMFGIGRGAGNLNTELVVTKLYKNIKINSLVELCCFIQKYVKKIYFSSENKWGYDLDYLLSGYLKIHPNYVSKMRDLSIYMNDRFTILAYIDANNLGKLFNLELFDDILEKYKKYIF